jgi:hypothetical protein
MAGRSLSVMVSSLMQNGSVFETAPAASLWEPGVDLFRGRGLASLGPALQLTDGRFCIIIGLMHRKYHR